MMFDRAEEVTDGIDWLLWRSNPLSRRYPRCHEDAFLMRRNRADYQFALNPIPGAMWINLPCKSTLLRAGSLLLATATGRCA